MCLSVARAVIININRPKDGETGRQKRAKLSLDPQGNPDGPNFLKSYVLENVFCDDVNPHIKRAVYRPN